MTKTELINGIKEVLGTSVDLSNDTVLEDIPEWDSLAIMSMVTYLASNCGKMLSFSEIKEFKTVDDILNAAGGCE